MFFSPSNNLIQHNRNFIDGNSFFCGFFRHFLYTPLQSLFCALSVHTTSKVILYTFCTHHFKGYSVDFSYTPLQRLFCTLSVHTTSRLSCTLFVHTTFKNLHLGLSA